MSSDKAIIVSGVCPVLETPFTSSGEIDLESFRQLVNHLIDVGVKSVMFPGFASEFYKLTDYERDVLSTTLINCFSSVPEAQVIISIPDHATHIAVARAKAAVKAGADWINILPPYFLGPGADAVSGHIDAILESVSPIPAIVQYAPSQTGSILSPSFLSSLRSQRPNLRQVKVESTPAGTMISQLLATEPALPSLVGYAGVQLIDSLRRGATGVQPGCSFVEIYLRIWELWTSGACDEAVHLHTRLLPYISYWMQGVELIVSAEKRISMQRGLISSDFCRAPSRRLDREELAMIDRFLAEFADLISSRT